MTNVVVKKEDDDVLGMINAGHEINEWRKKDQDHKGFFDDLFEKLKPADGYEFVVRDAADYLLTKKDKNKYEWDGKKLDIKPKDDSKGKKQMTIPIPSKQDLLAGYVGDITDDLIGLSGGNSAKREEMKKYLLAVIFLNRCQ